MHLSAPKSTIGHAEGAAGVHSLLVAVRALQARVCSPVAHLRCVSDHVVSAAGNAGFLVPIQSSGMGATAASSDTDVSSTKVIRSGCSAFGMSGVNAHAVVQTSSGDPSAITGRADTRHIFSLHLFRLVPCCHAASILLSQMCSS